MKIEILYIPGCPNHPPSVTRVREALTQERVSADVVEVAVNDVPARLVGFLGSPSIRVDGQDVDPSARSVGQYGLTCRTYIDGGQRVGVPPLEWIRAAVRQASGEDRGEAR
jgi:hypothetical protein